MHRRVLIPLTLVACLLLPGAGGSTAGARDDLVQFGPPLRLKVGKTLKYTVGCSADCDLTTSNTLHLPGRDLGPLVIDPDPLGQGKFVFIYVGLNHAAKVALAKSPAKARLKTTITATETDTGHETVVNRTFKFKLSSGR